ncbi:hypothetical protein ITJ43_03475 [Microbacterium sp. VKM Ac-2870]|uniref:hypothetical protein n=1 Tax=Microbacterium sp. VKM Ac-2870 TaxID=2783825 RepID=UPI00188AECAB|nr:hypothetical protein [Microbacterium sp. VKM Ac-2870]MBF4561187.1 hypothetical protein [Microbacterium sp. VKM Ac-2870]
MSGPTRRGRGRPRREYRIRIRAERREQPDYDKLARALLEHAAMEERARRQGRSSARDVTPGPADETPGAETEGSAS